MSISGLNEDAKDKLVEGGYRFVGDNEHSAVKVCRWTKKSLLDEGFCYKQKFYGDIHGIKSHRCLQMSPSLPFCDNKCAFCWRDNKLNSPNWEGPVDDPSEVLSESIEAQRELLSGFKGNPEVNLEKWREAQDPNLAAISLDGEPTLYPRLSGLVGECYSRDITPFVVTNGLHPERVESMKEPAQLYVSVVAPDEETYNETCKPLVEGAWEKLNETLDLLSELDCIKVLRLTLVEDLNMKDPGGYAKLIEKAQPDYVEPKGYVAVGHSRSRLGTDYMPVHSQIKEFSRQIEEKSSYDIEDEFEPSRVTLLKRD